MGAVVYCQPTHASPTNPTSTAIIFCLANANEKPELEESPTSFTASIWKHYGFPGNYSNTARHTII